MTMRNEQSLWSKDKVAEPQTGSKLALEPMPRQNPQGVVSMGDAAPEDEFRELLLKRYSTPLLIARPCRFWGINE
jgi:hypothetical protein